MVRVAQVPEVRAPTVERVIKVGRVKRYRVRMTTRMVAIDRFRIDCTWLDELPMLGGQVTWPTRRRRNRRRP